MRGGGSVDSCTCLLLIDAYLFAQFERGPTLEVDDG